LPRPPGIDADPFVAFDTIGAMEFGPSPALALACELIARRSVTPDDGGCQALIAARLARAGFVADARGGLHRR